MIRAFHKHVLAELPPALGLRPDVRYLVFGNPRKPQLENERHRHQVDGDDP